MTNRRHEALQRLRELRRKYQAELPGRIAELAGAADVVAAASDKTIGLRALMALAHKLAGSGGTFGLPELSRRAGAIEQSVERLIDSDRVSEVEVKKIQSAVEELRTGGRAQVGSLDGGTS